MLIDRDAKLGDRRAYVLRRLLAISDVLALVAAGIAVVALQTVVQGIAPDQDDRLVFLAFIPVWLCLASLLRLYHHSDRRLDFSVADEFAPIVMGITVWSWALLVARSVVESGAVRVFPSLTLWLIAIVTVLVGRAVTRAIARRRSWYRQRVAVVGMPLDVAQVVRRLRRHPEYGLDLVRTIETDGNGALRIQTASVVASRGTIGPHPLDVNGAEELTALEPAQVAELAAMLNIHRVIVATHAGDLEERSKFLRTLVEIGVHVDVVSGDPESFSRTTVLHYVEGIPVITIPAIREPRTWWLLKRGFDLGAAGVGLVVLSPLLLYCAIRIKLDSPGPVLFKQKRVGMAGKEFELVKFRTMTERADERKGEVATLNIHAHSDTPGMFKIPSDPRITRVGCTLRRWSLDELPQLWNVIKGEMSLVGPRPLILEEVALVGGHYAERFRVRPGITGLWQTLGRSDIGLDDMVKLDYAYTMNWSFSEDLRLLARTVGAVARGRGAY